MCCTLGGFWFGCWLSVVGLGVMLVWLTGWLGVCDCGLLVADFRGVLWFRLVVVGLC